MVNSVNTQPKTIKSSIFYVNDIHGQTPKMEQIASASIQWDQFVKQEKVDGLKLSSGDIFIGRDEKTNTTAAAFADSIGLQAIAIGNHEFDITASKFAELIKNSKAKFLGMNLNHPENCPLKPNVLKSMVIQENGNSYGIIGIQPVDLNSRIQKKDILEGITVDDETQTMKELQEEVDKFKKQGLNKIILLSHGGYTLEKKIAQTVSGIDIIIGGHSHDLIKGIEEGKNLFYSPTGEPVIITQAGRDGHNFGILNLEYNDRGVIVAVQNNVIPTKDYSKNIMMTSVIEHILGPSPQIGIVRKLDPYPDKPLIEENPYADFVADALRSELNADIAFINSGNFRGGFAPGNITARDISSIFPFKNKLCKVELTEKELVDALNHGGKSINTPDNKPNILQVSGLTYTLDRTGKVVDATFIDKTGNKRALNVTNPSTSLKFTTIYDNFLLDGGDDFTMLKKADSVLEHYPYDKDKVTIDYVKKLQNQPFDILKDNRIKFL